MAEHIEVGPSSAKSRATFSRDDSTVREFFNRLARVLTSGDVRALTLMWGTPAMVVADDEVLTANSSMDIEKFFSGAKSHYNARGIFNTRANIVRLNWITDRIVIAQVRWPYIDAIGNEVGEEMSTYTLRREDSGSFKVRVAVLHGTTGVH